MQRPMLSMVSPAEAARTLAQRAKALRLMKGWKRDTLAGRAGVSVSSLKRFETTGRGSLELVLKVALALGRLAEFGKLLQPPPAQSMAELERLAARPVCKRGRI